MINIEDFLKVEIRVGQILKVEEVESSEKLYRLEVDFGESEPRQVLSGIKKYFTPEDLLNQQFAFITNLEPRKIMGFESQAMILAGGEKDDNELALMTPNKKIKNGSRLG